MAVTTGIGTKVFRTEDGSVVIVPSSLVESYEPEEGMVEIHQVRKAVVTIPNDGIITADLELFPTALSIFEGKANYGMRDEDGVLKEISFVEFMDGSKYLPKG